MSAATIGSALVEKRLELGLEKGQAADKIGMSRTTYSSYEQDAQRPSVDVFPALAGFLEIAIEELLSLYGATCVAAIRPSLDRVLADQQVGSAPTERFEESELVIEVSAPSHSDVPYENRADISQPFVSTPTEPTLETLEVTDSGDASEPEVSMSAKDEEERVVALVEAPVDEAPFVASPAFATSPFITKVPKSDSREKSADQKKKKKKKKKKS
jgi:transcriptional regulator with XRE-family HTH domain